MDLLFWLTISLSVVTVVKLVWHMASFYWHSKRETALERRLEALEKRSVSDAYFAPAEFKPLPKPPESPEVKQEEPYRVAEL